MRKFIGTTLITLALAFGLSSAAAAQSEDARFHQRWAALGAGAVTCLAFDAIFDRLAPNEPKAVRNGMTTLFTLLTVAGIEAARQYQAGENGVDMGNVAAGATGALISASWSF
jgi:hypothetical protein